MRSPVDLIAELDEEAQFHLTTSLLIAYFKDSTNRLVGSDEPERLKKLTTLINQGGEPVGFIWCDVWEWEDDSGLESDFGYRVLSELEGDEKAHQFIEFYVTPLKSGHRQPPS